VKEKKKKNRLRKKKEIRHSFPAAAAVGRGKKREKAWFRCASFSEGGEKKQV